MRVGDFVKTGMQLPRLLALKKHLAPRSPDVADCPARHAEAQAERLGNQVAILFEGRRVTWAELNARANRYAHALAELGVGRGQVVSMLMQNRVEFLALLLALNKLGAIAGLINTNLRGRPLSHCIRVTESSRCIVGEDLTGALDEVRSDLPLTERDTFLFVPDQGDSPAPEWALDLNRRSTGASHENLACTHDNKLGDTALYLFTSGTTGLPKAAIVSNRRYLYGATMAARGGLRCGPEDRLYICLPLYHGNGILIGCGAALVSGASIFLRRRFSASEFLAETHRHETNCLIYIGELCRYLMKTPEAPDDRHTPVTRILGNGLRPDIWMAFKRRFGIRRIAEFYAASEGNVAFANLLNKDCTVGFTTSPAAIVQYDVDADEMVRDNQGRCIPAASGETGLLLGGITSESVFEGYTDADATEQKIVRGAFADGDAWFNTGDLLRQVDVGFTLGYPHYQFVDRVGDTFRWKGENVATNEVGEILNGWPEVAVANVYGVALPGVDGRAGMAALTLSDGAGGLEIAGFSRYVRQQLPVYARPVFLRICAEADLTGTFKIRKADLRQQGYDPARTTDPLYVLKPGSEIYEPLESGFAEKITAGQAGW